MRRAGLLTLILGSLLVPFILAVQHKAVIPKGLDMGLPFSPGMRTGDVLFLSGAIGNLPGTKEVKGGIQDQTRQVFNNFVAVLEAADMSLKDIVSTNVYLSDARHYQEMNQVYGQYFQNNPPVRTTVEGDIVIKDSLVEISAIAVNPDLPREYITPSGWPVPQRPYSWGILLGDTLFISGMVGRDVPSGELKTDSFEEQAKQAFLNVGSVLKSAGLDFRNVVSTKVYLSDARDFQAMNTIYRQFFKDTPPVRATVNARLANPEMKIEVQCIAVNQVPFSVVGEKSPSSPFSPALKIDNWLLTSGMVGRGPNGYVKGDPRAQTKQTLENLRKALLAGGMDFEDVVDVQVFLSDVRFYSDMNEVYREMMPSTPPARATVGTPLMSPDALVEIIMTARK